jgi:hypothetical protein
MKQLHSANLISSHTFETLAHDLWQAYNEANESILAHKDLPQ